MRWGLNFIGNQDCNWSPADKGGVCQFFPPPLTSLPSLFLTTACLPRDPSLAMWKDRGSAEWCREEREKRQKEREEKEGGEGDRGKEEYWSSRAVARESTRKKEDKEEGQRKRWEELKVRVRTVWSSELDRDTAAVTSVLISPSAGWWSVSVCVCVCGKPLPSLFWLQIAGAGVAE